MSGKKDYAWLKGRYEQLMGRPPGEKDLERLMRVKDVLGVDYDDPNILQLLALEYYQQLFEQVPEKIRVVITETETHASKVFENKAGEIAQKQAVVVTSAANEQLKLLTKAGNTMISAVGDQAKEKVGEVIDTEFRKTLGPAFANASVEVSNANFTIRGFARRYRGELFLAGVVGGMVGSALVLAGMYFFSRP